MKFLCVDCDAQMASVDQVNPGDGTLSIIFRCPQCRRAVAMLANPMETQMVSSLCVEVGGRTAPEQPFEGVRSQLKSGGETALEDASRKADPTWSDEAEQRLARIPGFVRGMVRRLYVDWAESKGIAEITVEVMDKARAELGLEGM
jgi:hypothetical protein